MLFVQQKGISMSEEINQPFDCMIRLLAYCYSLLSPVQQYMSPSPVVIDSQIPVLRLLRKTYKTN